MVAFFVLWVLNGTGFYGSLMVSADFVVSSLSLVVSGLVCYKSKAKVSSHPWGDLMCLGSFGLFWSTRFA